MDEVDEDVDGAEEPKKRKSVPYNSIQQELAARGVQRSCKWIYFRIQEAGRVPTVDELVELDRTRREKSNVRKGPHTQAKIQELLESRGITRSRKWIYQKEQDAGRQLSLDELVALSGEVRGEESPDQVTVTGGNKQKAQVLDGMVTKRKRDGGKRAAGSVVVEGRPATKRARLAKNPAGKSAGAEVSLMPSVGAGQSLNAAVLAAFLQCEGEVEKVRSAKKPEWLHSVVSLVSEERHDAFRSAVAKMGGDSPCEVWSSLSGCVPVAVTASEGRPLEALIKDALPADVGVRRSLPVAVTYPSLRGAGRIPLEFPFVFGHSDQGWRLVAVVETLPGGGAAVVAPKGIPFTADAGLYSNAPLVVYTSTELIS